MSICCPCPIWPKPMLPFAKRRIILPKYFGGVVAFSASDFNASTGIPTPFGVAVEKMMNSNCDIKPLGYNGIGPAEGGHLWTWKK